MHNFSINEELEYIHRFFPEIFGQTYDLDNSGDILLGNICPHTKSYTSCSGQRKYSQVQYAKSYKESCIIRIEAWA